MNTEVEKTPDTSGAKEKYQLEASKPDEVTQSVAEDIGSVRGKKESLEVTVGQLEEKVSALDEKVKSALESRKWIFIATLTVIGGILTAIGIIIGATTLVFNILKNSQDTYQNLQNTYYQELIELRKEIDNKPAVQELPSQK